MPLEQAITNSILGYLNRLPLCKAEKIPGNALSSGRADIGGCIRGQAFRIEVKTPDNRNIATPKQELNLRRWRHAGAITSVTYSAAFIMSFFTAEGIDLPSNKRISKLEANGCWSWIERGERL